MSFRDDLIGILSGGLPTLIDGPDARGRPALTTQTTEGSPIQPRRVEEIAPAGGFRDSEPFLMGVTQNQVLITTAAIIGVIGLVLVLRK